MEGKEKLGRREGKKVGGGGGRKGRNTERDGEEDKNGNGVSRVLSPLHINVGI